MPLVYLPNINRLFSWGSDVTEVFRIASGSSFVTDLARIRSSWLAEVLTPEGLFRVEGQSLPLRAAVQAFAVLRTDEVMTFSASAATWMIASKLAMSLIARERVVPTLVRVGERFEARWAASFLAPEDAANFEMLAKFMPPAAHAVPISKGALDVWTPQALLRSFINSVVDGQLRCALGLSAPLPKTRNSKNDVPPGPWPERWQMALEGMDCQFELQGFAERSVPQDIARWSEPSLGSRDRLRACFRLELPSANAAPFMLRFLLQLPDDPSLLVSAEDIWSTKARHLSKFGRAFRDPQESLIEALGRAARLFPPIGVALEKSHPEYVELDSAAAWRFLGEGAADLAAAGFGVIVPGELTAAGQRRLRLRMRVGNQSKAAGIVTGTGGLNFEGLVDVDWQAVIGDQELTARELAALAKQKSSLVQFRGEWVAVDSRELADIQKRLASGAKTIRIREAIRISLAGETNVDSQAIGVIASGALADMIAQLRQSSMLEARAPESLRATLRPYQQRGLSWLSTMGALGLGACLADDMGLGKTIQFLAFLLWRMKEMPQDPRPALLIAPTSVVGNWEREVSRFAPTLQVHAHHGPDRAKTSDDFPARSGSLVITTYGLLRRDAELLSKIDWSVVALDEAQNIKNASSTTAKAARSLRASQRFALTGTPVENRLAELWSILEFVNPGLLGPLEVFRRDFAVPIERYGNEKAAERLRRMVSPFILRRLKSDPNVVQDLPAKNEMKVICTLTKEQASLYKAVVDAELKRIEDSEGIQRRGRVLALLMATKQICNHPAQYLRESGPLPKRSGKLARLSEMLDEALAAGDKALVFTQFREMGERLVPHLETQLGCEVLFLHGGTSKDARDEMVRRFQDEGHGPKVFVLSVKAGGTGLNLTAATHVFHYDRWWNPAVEDQATDRAYRIGQKQSVQVHKFVCAGTVEEKIDRLLEQKRELASKVVGAGEQWITEMDTRELRELFAFSDSGVEDDDESEKEMVQLAKPRQKGKKTKVGVEMRHE